MSKKETKDRITYGYSTIAKEFENLEKSPIAKKIEENMLKFYSLEELKNVPRAIWTGFCVGNPLKFSKNRGNLLDLGCGMGVDCYIGSKYFEKVVGLDLSYAMLIGGRKNIIERNISWINSDAIQLPFIDSIFDTVISNGLLNHILEKDEFLKETYRVLSDNGELIISEIVVSQGSFEKLLSEKIYYKDFLAIPLIEEKLIDLIYSSDFENLEEMERRRMIETEGVVLDALTIRSTK